MKVLAMMVFVVVMMVACGGEEMSSAEIVCESFVECSETELSFDECVEMKLTSINANFAGGKSLRDMTVSDVKHGEKWNECVLNQDFCDRFKESFLMMLLSTESFNYTEKCLNFSEFDWDYYWYN